jgi:hypothetical protein
MCVQICSVLYFPWHTSRCRSHKDRRPQCCRGQRLVCLSLCGRSLCGRAAMWNQSPLFLTFCPVNLYPSSIFLFLARIMFYTLLYSCFYVVARLGLFTIVYAACALCCSPRRSTGGDGVRLYRRGQMWCVYLWSVVWEHRYLRVRLSAKDSSW